jgi:hypothetical protein
LANLRIAKRAALMAGRYAHAKQFNRYRRELRLLRSRLGRIIRDIARKVVGSGLEKEFHEPLAQARQIRLQEQRQRGFKFECIGKGKARGPYEFGVKAFGHYGRAPRRPVHVGPVRTRQECTQKGRSGHRRDGGRSSYF